MEEASTFLETKRYAVVTGANKGSGLKYLDVTNPASVVSLADFIKTQFGKLDILVNNAGIGGSILDSDAFARASEAAGGWPVGEHVNWNELVTQTFEMAEGCLKTNYYGAKGMIEALIPLL
ncbi:hypothetical protein LWI29_011116 [Acer saccharum]|uniref:Uncharacterized protein n=1 Tax=Acer saccharum TaxID=4024 RepID=A0AA39VHZ2_ACESA|nr:hypothetical protein LWI29_011116 [Acer saccharum]